MVFKALSYTKCPLIGKVWAHKLTCLKNIPQISELEWNISVILCSLWDNLFTNILLIFQTCFGRENTKLYLNVEIVESVFPFFSTAIPFLINLLSLSKIDHLNTAYTVSQLVRQRSDQNLFLEHWLLWN